MSQTLKIPTATEIAERIRVCRDELAVLKRLQRLAATAERAEQAKTRDRLTRAQSAREAPRGQ
jgi:hypothetical protein